MKRGKEKNVNMDDFDLEYADELDALDDFEPPSFTPCKPKRSLTFETPTVKKGKALQDVEDFTPLHSPSHGINGTAVSPKFNRLSAGTPLGKSRPEKRSWNSHQDGEFTSDLPDLTQSKAKRARKDDEDDHDIPPPPPLGVEDRIVNLRSKSTRPTIHQDEEDINDRLIETYDLERPRVHKRIPSGDFISTTGFEGERVYLKLKNETAVEREIDSIDTKKTSSQLLRVSIQDLRIQIENERQEKLLSDAHMLTQVHSELNGKSFYDEDVEDVTVDDTAEETTPESPENLLWVEKYAPQKYTDLLSEESMNRILLHWLKLWDYVVFGKDVKLKKKEKENEKKNKDFKKKKFPEVIDELDKHNRPVQKVVLLNGPPGLGKTTLAHVVAKHCGYNVVEMNASDDRSAEVFKTKMEAATQMKSVLEADPRPNCLIIDEIDGAPQAAINVLLNFIKRTDEPTVKKKKKEEGILLRPIICICNDQYVPSLRLLRQNALVLNFPQTESARLASRLAEIIKREELKADINTLLALCSKTDNDIRSSLNTLQFCKRHHKELTLRILQTMNVGQKDMNKSLFSMWYDIFSMPRQKRNRFISIQDIKEDWQSANNTSVSARFDNILRSAQATGEYSKLIQGMFENFLECKFKDPKLEGLNLSMEWLCFTDQVNRYIGHSQDYSLMPYIPYVAVTFHLLFAANQLPKIQYPHADHDAFTKQTRSENLVTSMMSDMTPAVRKFLDEMCVVMDVLPPLMDVIQPTLRPVNTQLYSTREKEEMNNLIRIMIAYNMTYIQEKSPEGQYLYVLDPNMEEVVRFTGMKQHRQLTYAAKQLIAREIGLEKLRRSEASLGNADSSLAPTEKSRGGVKSTVNLPNHLQKLEAKPLLHGEEQTVQKDFFGRVIKRKTPEAKPKKTEEKKNVLQTDIWFHFTEGFSNAVRRNVKVQDFM